MNRQEARKRRERIAKAMKTKQNIFDVAIEYDVSEDLVRRACREFGVLYSGHRAAKPRRTKVSRHQATADLRTGKTPSDIADRYKVSLEKVVRLQKRIASGLPAK